MQRTVTAVSFGSQKWAHWRPPGGGEVLRVSLGRDGLPVDHLDDDALVERAVDEVGHHLGLDLQPSAVRVSRWPAAFPQYRPHHHDWVARVDAALPAGLVVTGASYRGIGVPACIAQAHDAGGTSWPVDGRGRLPHLEREHGGSVVRLIVVGLRAALAAAALGCGGGGSAHAERVRSRRECAPTTTVDRGPVGHGDRADHRGDDDGAHDDASRRRTTPPPATADPAVAPGPGRAATGGRQRRPARGARLDRDPPRRPRRARCSRASG